MASDSNSVRAGQLGKGGGLSRLGAGTEDRLLALKEKAERANKSREEEEGEVEASFRAACLEIILYLLFVVIFAIVTWVRGGRRARLGRPRAGVRA